MLQTGLMIFSYKASLQRKVTNWSFEYIVFPICNVAKLIIIKNIFSLYLTIFEYLDYKPSCYNRSL
jgi:hypothetical protein